LRGGDPVSAPFSEGPHPFRLSGLDPSTPIETASRELSQGLQTILDHSPAVVFVKRVPDWRYLLINRRFEEAFVLRREDLIGKRDEDFQPADIVAEARALDEKVYATGGSSSAEERVRHADGSLHTYFSVRFPLRNALGEIYAVCGIATDITERKQAEEAIAAIHRGTATGTGEGFLRSLVLEFSRIMGTRWAFVGKLTAPGSGRIRTVAMADSGKIVENFEYDLEGTPCAKVIGRNACIFPSGVARAFPADRLLQEMGVESYQGIPILASDGSPLGLVVTLHDRPLERQPLSQELLAVFAARAGGELQRLDSESRWSTLARNAPQFILTVDADERIRYINHVIPPLRESDVLGASVYEMIPPEFRETARRTIRGVFASGQVGAYETLGPGSGEEFRWYEVTVGPVLESGRVTSVVLIASDVHERKRAIQALRESEARWRLLVENAPEYILKVERSGRIQFINRNPAGGPPEALVGRRVGEICSPEDEGVLLDALAQVFERGETRWISVRARTSAEGTRAYDVSLGPVRGVDGVREAILIVVDVSERRKLEDQLLQSQKMEAVGRLAGGVAHDFNNLLTVIQGHLMFQQEELKPGDPLRVHTEVALQASRRAAELTQQLLTFSRKSIQKPEVFDLNEELRSQGVMLRRLIGEHLRLEFRLHPEPLWMICDAAQFHQVVLNLAVNAREAMPSNGTLAVSTRPVQEGGRAWVEVDFADTGVGIPAEVLPHLFEPFFTTKDRGRGTGLGLSIVHGVVQRAGGTIDVRSRVGEGTAFVLRFPVAAAPEKREQAAAVPATFRGSERILVAEDEEMVRRVTCEVLAQSGYLVLEAAHGRAALRILEDASRPVDLLLTDVVMPELGGRELAERARALRPGLRILFVSGYTDDEIVRHGVLAAEIDLLQKPYLPQALLARIREILDRPARA
jgi:PAS domain S-box-containing protein